MADHHINSLLFLVLFSCLVCSSYSYQFVVGGRDGWVVKPSENYNQWAERMRFQVNDTLLFKYKSGSDSVVVVNKDDYDKCNAGNPITKLDDGNSVFTLNRSGPFYFISGNKPNCDQGQKLIVVVLAIRTPPSSPLAPPPTASPPQGSSPSPSPVGPGPAASPFSPSPSTGAPVPATSPMPPSPAGLSPGGASPEPSAAPGSPSSSTPESSTSGSPASSTPGSPASSTPGSPASSTPGSPASSTPGSGTPADANAPPSRPRSLAAAPCSGVLLMSAVSVVMSLVLV